MVIQNVEISKILDCLKSILLNEYCINETSQRYNKNADNIILPEFDDKGNVLYSVLCKLNNEPLVCKFDKNIKDVSNGEKLLSIVNGDIFHFFNKIKGLSSLCDYLVFYPYNDKNKQEHLFCFLIDLKQEDVTDSPIQILGQEIFAQFLLQQALKMTAYQIANHKGNANSSTPKEMILNAHYRQFVNQFPFRCIRLLYRKSRANNQTKQDTSRNKQYNFDQTLVFQYTEKHSLDFFCMDYLK